MTIKQLHMDFKVIQSVNEKKGPVGLPEKLVTAKDFFDAYAIIANYTFGGMRYEPVNSFIIQSSKQKFNSAFKTYLIRMSGFDFEIFTDFISKIEIHYQNSNLDVINCDVVKKLLALGSSTNPKYCDCKIPFFIKSYFHDVLDIKYQEMLKEI